MGVLEKMGLKLLREFFEKRGDNLRSMTVANRAGCPSRDIVMDSRRFMSSNTGVHRCCARDQLVYAEPR